MTDDIISEAIGLLVRGGAPVWAVVALALVVAVVVVVGRRVGSMKIPLPPPEQPAPPAAWNADPSQGATVAPNDTPGSRGGPDGQDGG